MPPRSAVVATSTVPRLRSGVTATVSVSSARGETVSRQIGEIQLDVVFRHGGNGSLQIVLAHVRSGDKPAIHLLRGSDRSCIGGVLEHVALIDQPDVVGDKRKACDRHHRDRCRNDGCGPPRGCRRRNDPAARPTRAPTGPKAISRYRESIGNYPAPAPAEITPPGRIRAVAGNGIDSSSVGCLSRSNMEASDCIRAADN